MKLLTLNDLVPLVDTGLWFLLERPYFAQDMLSTLPIAYSNYYSNPIETRNAQASGGRHNEIFTEISRMLGSQYNTKVVDVSGQHRLLLQAPDSSYYAFVLRKARAVSGGFGTSRYGKALEGASQLHLLETLPLVERKAFTRGIFLAFDESSEKKNHVDMWLAYEWSASQGSDFVACDACAFLGSVPFQKGLASPRKLNDTGGTVEAE